MQYKETALGGLAHEYQNFDDNGNKRSLKERREFDKNMSDY